MNGVRVWWAVLFIGCRAAEAPSVTLAAPAIDAAAPIAAYEEELPCGAYAPDGASPDATKARACLEREVKSDPCGDHVSPSLARLELAVSLIDGTGGPADSKRGLALFDGCFEDASVQTVREHEAKHEAAFGSCDAFAMTTLASSACIAEHVENEDIWLRVVKRTMSSDRAALFAAATKAHDAYAFKVGAITYARFAGGTMRDPAMRAAILAQMKRRHTRIERLMQSNWIPRAPELAIAEENAARALATARADAEPDTLPAINDAVVVWPAYRDAEVAFYESYRPGERSAVIAALDVERYADFCDAP